MTIRIDQPQAGDLVDSVISVAGVGTGFEGQLNYRVTEGQDEVTGYFNAGSMGVHQPFQFQIDVSGASFSVDTLQVQLFEIAAREGGERDLVSVPVIYGERILPGYHGYREHTVASGETPWAIAQRYYGNGSHFHRIVRANPTEITDPDQVNIGQVLRIPVNS